jgi:AcrR family transcriptional regulator
MSISQPKLPARKAVRSKAPVSRATAEELPVPGRRQRRATETRLRIFRSALALIAERGLHGVTVEDITEAADVGKGTFFNYFETKDQVLGVMAEVQIGKVRETISLNAHGNLTIHGTLHQLAQRLAEEPGRSPALARALMSSFLGSAGVREIMKRTLEHGRKAVEELVAAGQERGEILPSLKKEKVSLQFLQTVMGTVLFWSLHETPALNSLIEDSFKNFWRSISISGEEQES